MSDKKHSGFSGMIRKLSTRSSKKHDSVPPPQGLVSSSKGAASLSPDVAYFPPRPSPSHQVSTTHGDSPSTAAAEDSQFSFLAQFDTKFLIDDSSSMSTDIPSRWQQVSKILGEIAPVCTKYDEDGIDIHFLNQSDREEFLNVTDANRVHEIFRQSQAWGSTPTASRLWAILNPYLKECEKTYDPKGQCLQNPPKKLNVIVLTDGVPDESPKKVLLNIGQRLNQIGAENDQLGVMFCQIGTEHSATAALEELDDKLQDLLDDRDFVDHLPYGGDLSGKKLLKLVLGAVNKRLDRMEAK